MLGSSRYPFPGNDFASYIIKAQGSISQRGGHRHAGLAGPAERHQAGQGIRPGQRRAEDRNMLMSIMDAVTAWA